MRFCEERAEPKIAQLSAGELAITTRSDPQQPDKRAPHHVHTAESSRRGYVLEAAVRAFELTPRRLHAHLKHVLGRRLATTFVRELRQVDSEVVASQIRPLERNLFDSVAPRRFSVSLMTAFAVAALVLAVTGIYAVIMYSVSQRAREIGIRIALGARRSNIMRLVMGEGARYIIVGLVFGIAMAAGLMRLVSTMLFGVTAGDVATFGQVSAIVAVVSFLACAVPTVRALRPGSIALHTE
jgi:hypothetical protein